MLIRRTGPPSRGPRFCTWTASVEGALPGGDRAGTDLHATDARSALASTCLARGPPRRSSLNLPSCELSAFRRNRMLPCAGEPTNSYRRLTLDPAREAASRKGMDSQ